jgi:hypothetical protein
MGFILGLAVGEPSNIVSKPEGLKFEPRPCILLCVIILAYGSPYGVARVA